MISYVTLFYLQLGKPTELSRWIEEIKTIKLNAVENINKPKIVVLSGSNSLFGIRAADIESSLGIPTVNMALQGGLGKYIFDYIKPVLNRGDTVLLPLEYSFYLRYEWDATAIDYILARDPEYFRRMNILDKISFILRTPITRVIKGYQTPVRFNHGYSSNNLNSHGDETSNIVNAYSQQIISELAPFPKTKLGIESAATENIDRFIDWCNEAGVKVFVTYPSFLKFDVYFTDGYYVNFFNSIETFWQKRHVTVIATPEDFLYPQELMFDTHYHPNEDGMTRRTERLINELRILLTTSSTS